MRCFSVHHKKIVSDIIVSKKEISLDRHEKLQFWNQIYQKCPLRLKEKLMFSFLDMEAYPIRYQRFKSGSRIPKNLFYLLQWKLFKNDENYFLFNLKSSFSSQDIWIFVLTFSSHKKDGLIGKIRLISKFMTSQPGQQTILINILSNISRSKTI